MKKPPKVIFGVRIDKNLKEFLQEMAKKDRRSISQVVTFVLEDFAAKEGFKTESDSMAA